MLWPAPRPAEGAVWKNQEECKNMKKLTDCRMAGSELFRVMKESEKISGGGACGAVWPAHRDEQSPESEPAESEAAEEASMCSEVPARRNRT